jgi:hypothetical protein
MEFSQDLFVGFFLGYILRSVLVHFIARGRGILTIQQAEKISLKILKDTSFLYKHVEKWTSVVSESLEEVLKDVRHQLLTRFSEEEVDEIMEEWDISFVEHSSNIWAQNEEACEKWKATGLTVISNRLRDYGYPPDWTDWASAMQHIDEEK